METVQDPNGLITTYVYNGFGDLKEIISPDTGTTILEHDKAGNVTRRTDARGKVADYTYDFLNRKLTEFYPADIGLDTVYTYDETAYNNYGIGRLTSVVDNSGSTSYFYDSRGLVDMIDRVIGTDVYRVDYDYDASGLVTAITYPSGRVVSYSRDAAGRINLVSVTKDQVTTVLADSFSYNPFGPVTNLTLGNGITRMVDYDSSYRVDNLVDGAVLSRDTTYDVYDNVHDITDGVDGSKSQILLEYDDLDRLTNATGAYGDIDYGDYDGTGNRQALSVDGGQDNEYAYDSGTHHLASITGPDPQNFTYDSSGNMTVRNDITQVFDDRGRLSQSIVTGGANTTYVYNAMGERVQKTVTTATTETKTHYVYDEHRLLFEFDGTSGKEYAYLHGQPLAAWHGISPATLGQTTIQISKGGDDAEEKNNGVVEKSGDILELGTNNGNPRTVAIRINEVDIPQDAVINSAHLQFNAKGSNSGIADFLLRAENIGDAPGITTSNNNITNRTLTTASAGWTPLPWTTGDRGPAQMTSDIGALVQEVVARADWAEGNAMLLILTGTGQRQAHSYNQNASKAAELIVEYMDQDTQAETLYYYHNDHLGTPQVMTNQTQSVVWQADYKPFGEVTIAPGSTVTNNLRFPGQYFDAESGLHYNYFRDYDPSTGRYVESDPIGLAGGLNTYAYVGGNPLELLDPFGLAPPTDWPGSALVKKNIQIAENISDPTVFHKLVVDSGSWDYKQSAPAGQKWEDFGNYHYGLTGAATGIFNPDTLLREAGKNQCDKGLSDPKWGTPLASPHGDDPKDQYWIREGIRDYYSGLYGKPATPSLYKDLVRNSTSAYSNLDALTNYRVRKKSWYRNASP